MIFKKSKAKVGLTQNFKYVLKDKDGNVKRLFQPNKLLTFLTRRGIMSVGSKFAKTPLLFGMFKNEMNIANLITNAGLAGVASRINGAGAESAFTYIGVGIGTTASALADTALESEITTGGGERGSATASRTTTDVTNDTARLVLTYNFTATFAVTEAGALNAVSSGVLLNRQVFTAVNVTSGDSLQVTIDVDVD